MSEYIFRNENKILAVDICEKNLDDSCAVLTERAPDGSIIVNRIAYSNKVKEKR